MSTRLSLLIVSLYVLAACSDSSGSGGSETDALAAPDLPPVPGSCVSDDDCMSGDEMDLCLGGYTCDQGACVAKNDGPVICEDENPGDCLDSLCDPATGTCTIGFVVDGTPCVHEDPCIEAATCTAGSCSGGDLIDCDDANDCTIDVCVPGDGCEHQVNSGQPCDDGDPCTSGDICDGASCVGGQNNCGNCGDLFCSLDEDCETCPVDCGACEGVCGDGTCDSGEETTCPQDCVGGLGSCGDGVCDLGEQLTCPEDCEDQGGGSCGDGVCDLGEQLLCPEDCENSGPSCGPAILCDGVCDAFLDAFACPDDCCGNATCDDFEDEECCYADCGPEVVCGDEICDDLGGEDLDTCPEDCEEEPMADEAPDAGSTEDSDTVDEEILEGDALEDIGPAEDTAPESDSQSDSVTQDVPEQADGDSASDVPTEDAATDTAVEDTTSDAPTGDTAADTASD